jgi:sortase A
MMKNRLSTTFLVIIFCIGLFLLLYPSVSDYWNSMHQSRLISGYAEAVIQIDSDRYSQIWSSAHAYNQALAERGNTWVLTDEQRDEYHRQLDVAGGIISYIEIPAIDCALPIYHGTSDAVLQVAIGHLEGSSLPVGGESTHCVVSGHRGLPSAQLFSRLDQLVTGDVFFLQTLDETLTYEVDQILIVLPYELEALEIQQGEDLCTLVTCTPYGVNSHRLLVRGHRIATPEEARVVRVTADAHQIEPMIVAPVVAAPMLLILLIMMLATTRKKHEE